LLISVVVVPKILNLIPLAVLASILLTVGYKLAKPSLFSQMYKLGPKQFYPFVITMVGIVFTDLLTGITLGVGVAIFNLVRNNYRNSHFMHIKETDDACHKVEMNLSEEVTFLNKGAILQELNRLPDCTEITIDIRTSVRVDYDVYEIIDNFRKNSAPDRGIKVIVKSDTEYSTADY
ncbi:MAG: SulP family inorganic anion transporter, partial [Flavobacteriales bacterium]|nr:SulP family inorganic anion transporter [Flavobacteriales bacterium]